VLLAVAVAYSLAWRLFGVERLRVSGDTLARTFAPIPFAVSHRWAVAAVTELRVDVPDANASGGSLVFSCGGETFRVGLGLSAADAAALLAALTPRLSIAPAAR
jgi:hypothetical protein